MSIFNRFLVISGILCLISAGKIFAQSAPYSWLTNDYQPSQSIAERITPPEGYQRIEVKSNSFAHWLRHLPLLEGKPQILDYAGNPIARQHAHAAVIDIDVGKLDLQQCADTVMRLRAEYLYSRKNYNAIHFNFTSGDNCLYTKWANGCRPVVTSRIESWKCRYSKDFSHPPFRKYLNMVFNYAGSASLEGELKAVTSLDQMQIGDVFIQGGHPGHAVIVVDIAKHHQTGKRVFLVAQSYMPAQSVHVLRNFHDEKLDPWYALDFEELQLPVWRPFKSSDLKRFEKE